jgi:cellulose biosynthesis protein BcsQ
MHLVDIELTSAAGARPRLKTCRSALSPSPTRRAASEKTTTTILLAAELADARPELRIVLEDQDPDRHLTTMLPGDGATPFVLDQLGATQGDVRLIDTGPGDLAQLRTLLRRVDQVIVPVRLETMTLQALNKFLPVVEEVQDMRGGPPDLLGFVVTWLDPSNTSAA